MSSPYVNIPLPPVLAPFATPPAPLAPVGKSIVILYRWNPDLMIWGSQQGLGNWDDLPAGYYHTPINYPGLPAVEVVAARTDPSGNIVPNVIGPPDKWRKIGGGGTPGPDAPQWPPLPPVPPDLPLCALGEFWVPEFNADVNYPNRFILPDGSQYQYGICLSLDISLIIPTPTCPPGYHYDSTQETCIPDDKVNPPPPNCPSGTHWDPGTGTCQPDIPPPPPFQQGKPCIPDPSPDDDELGDLLNCVNENLIVIQQLLQQHQQGFGGGDGSLDPVTCTQLTQIAVALNFTLQAIASAITTLVQPGATPIDLTPITDKLQAIADAIAKEPEETSAAPPPSDPSVDEFIQQLATDGFFAPDVSQLVTG